MKNSSTKLKRIGKRTISLLLSVLLVSQIMDFSVLSINAAEESGEPQTSQNEQTDPVEEESEQEPETSQEESEPENSIEEEPVVYEDLNLGSNYTLTEDREVNNLNLTNGTLDLNNHVLTVHGNVNVTRGTLFINKGYLECSGNFTMTNYYSYLKMNNVNDYILVHGNFAWNSASISVLNSGTIEVKGNFYDNATGNSYNFVSSGSNKVLLSGEMEQKIVQKNTKSYIHILEIDNQSEDGITADTPIIAGTIIRNGCNISYPIEGEFGYKLTQNQVTIPGDLYLIGEELDLNGNMLNIQGDLIQAGGTININGGTLNVSGDYRIQSYTLDNNDTPVYSYSTGYLLMRNEDDIVNVNGDFVMASTHNQIGMLTDGVLSVGGNFTQKTTNFITNFSPSGNHKTVFNGNDSQIITFDSSAYNQSHFQNVEFANLTNGAVKLSGNNIVTGEISVTGGKPSGFINLYTTAFIKTNTINANIGFSSSYTFTKDIVINGNVTTKGDINLAGHTVEMYELSSQNSKININNGTLKCNESLILNSTNSNACYIIMSNENDHVIVDGDFISQNYNNNQSVMTAGTLEIKGDFIQRSGINGTNAQNFRASGTHKTLFNGTSPQTINFSSPQSYFNIVEINNTSTEGVTVADSFNHSELIVTSGNITLADGSAIGEKLTADKTVGDLYLGAGTYDLDGHKLTVTGDLIQSGGTMKINSGTLDVQGDYRIQKETGSGENISYSNSTGNLIMTNSDDRVNIAGDFFTESVNDHSGKLTNGIMTVKGNFFQLNTNTKNNFYTSGNHKMIFNGTENQQISMASSKYNNSHFENVNFANSSQDGIDLSGEITVTGNISSSGSNISGYIYLHSTATIVGNNISADVEFPNGYTFANDTVINGDVTTNGMINLAGHSVTVKDLLCQNSEVNINNGTLMCNGSLTIKSTSYNTSYLKMTNENDHVIVDMDFISQNYNNNQSAMTAGTLEIKGDFIQRSGINSTNTQNFRASGTHKTVFNGTSSQTITFSSPQSYFNIVEINNTSTEGITVTDSFNHSQLNVVTGNILLPDGSTVGRKLTQNETVENLYLGAGTYDLDGHILTVTGNLIQSGGTMNINGGTLNVQGDYRIQKENVNGETVTYSSSTGNLIMTNADDRVNIDGDFVMGSVNNHSSKLSNGIMIVKGNFSQLNTNTEYNFNTSGNHKIIFNGTESQTISIASPAYNKSHFVNVEFANTSQSGITLSDGVTATGNVTNTGGIISGYIYLHSTATIINNNINANIRFPNEYTFANNTVVNGDIFTTSSLNLAGNRLESNNFHVYDSVVTLNGGELICNGSIYFRSQKYSSCYLNMNNTNDHAVIYGDFVLENYCTVNPTMSAGILEIKGDFIQRTSASYANEENFRVGGSHKTIFNGTSTQTISFSSPKSYFNIVEIKNYTNEGVYCSNGLNASEIITNNCKVTYNGNETSGFTLFNDLPIDSDVILIGDTLDLNGHTLTINGNLFHKAGTIDINGGTLIVNGNYYMQSAQKDSNDNNIPSGYGSGILNMTNSNDHVIVTGDFTAKSIKSHTERLTAGILEVGGDFMQDSSETTNNFETSGSFALVFNGTSKQNISFSNPTVSQIANVVFNNSSADGIYIESNHMYIRYSVDDQSANIHGYIGVSSLSGFTNNSFSGNVITASDSVLTNNIQIRGQLYVDSNMDLNGFTINVGSVYINRGCVKINGGQINCNNGFTVYSNGKLEMTKSEDYILVGGDFVMNSYSSHSGLLTNGVLEIKGDFSQSGSGSSFVCSGEHKVILSGKSSSYGRLYKQTISFENTNNSKFNQLVLTVPVNYYNITNGTIDTICNHYSLEIRDTIPPTAVEGVSVVERTASSIKLSWNSSEDNIEVIGYDIYRDNTKIATVSGTEYTDRGLTPETAYNYKICAFDEVRNLSDYSDTIAMSTLADTSSPDAPQQLKIKNKTGTAITLSWLPVSDDVGCTGYKIYRNSTIIATVGNVITYKDTGLDSSTLYSYKIKALDQAENESDYSNEVSGYTVLPHINAMQPAEYTTFYGNTADISVRFMNSGNSTGNSVKFEYSADGVMWYDVVNYLAGQQTYSNSELFASVSWNIANLTSGTYYVKATLYDADGSTDIETAEYTIDHSDPDVVQTFAVQSSNGVVSLSWSVSSEADFASYEIFRSQSQNGSFESIGTITNKNTVYYEDKNVNDSQTYYYYIKVNDKHGRQSVASSVESITVSDDEQAPVIGEFNGTTRINSNASIHVPATDNKGVAQIKLEYYDSTNQTWITIGTNNSGTIAWDTTEHPDGSYLVRATASDTSGNQSVPKEKTLVIDNTGPSKPTNLSATSTSTTVSIKWNDTEDTDLAYFQVEQKVNNEFESVGRVSLVLGMNITELDSDTEYVFRVVGYDDLGNRGIASNEITVSTAEDSVKPYISNILPSPSSVKNNINFRITVNDNSYAKTLKLYYSGDNETWTEYQTLINNNHSKDYTFTYNADVSGFDDGIIYFKAIAEDENENNSEAAVVSYKIDTIAPQIITDLSATDRQGYAELNWSVTDDDTDHFMIYRSENQSGVYTVINDNCNTINYYDNSVVSGAVYSYKIKAVDAVGNTSELSNEAIVQISEDTENPVIYGFNPTDESVVGINPKINAVVYDARLDTVYFEYRKSNTNDLWREFGKQQNINGTYEKIEAVWNTTGLTSDTYLFRVIAIDYNGNMTTSSEISYTLDADAPLSPVLELLQDNYKLSLEWNSDNDVSFYKLYKKSYFDSGYKFIAKTTDTQYEDRDVIPNVIYTYKLEAYDACGNHSESNEMSAFAYDVDVIAPVAVAAEEITAIQDYEIILDGTESTDNVKIRNFVWNMGNGESVYGARTTYVYSQTGTYTATLTVTDTSGNTNSTEFTVTVLDKTNCGRKTVRVNDQNGNPLKYAYVYLYSADENNKTLKTDSNGLVTVSGAFGEQRIAAYKQGYLPKEQIIYIDSLASNDIDTIVLEDGELVVGQFSVHRMTLEEMVEAGIDFNDPMNYDSFTFSVDLKFKRQPIPTHIEYIYDGFGNGVGNGSGGGAGGSGGSGSGGNYSGLSNTKIKKVKVETEEEEELDIYVYIHTEETISWLKEMFTADLGIINCAAPQFELTNCLAEIELPEGLSLAATNSGQSFIQSMGTIPGQSSKSVSWYIRGDESGKYDLTANFAGTLMPFNAPFNIQFQSENSLDVHRGEGLHVYVYPESTGYIGMPYYIQYELRNESDREFINLETTFGNYESPAYVNLVYIKDPVTGLVTPEVDVGEDIFLDDVNKCNIIPVLYGGETLHIGRFGPGESLFGTYKTIFDAPDDPDKYYYKLVDAVATALEGADTGVQVHISPIPGHITKTNVEYRIIENKWGDPVDTTTGAFTDSINAMSLKCDPAISFDLQYNSLSEKSGECGNGWSHVYESYLEPLAGRIDLHLSPDNTVTFVDETLLKREFNGTLTQDHQGIQLAETEDDGGEKLFMPISSGMEDYELLRNTNGTYTLTTPAKQLYDFNSEGKLTKITQSNGKYVTFSYTSNSMRITEPTSGMYMTANYNSESGLLTSVTDYTGRTTTFAYENGNLIRATNALNESVSYIYDSNNRIIEEKNNENKSFVKNTYDKNGRVVKQDDGDSTTPLTTYKYDVDAEGATKTRITDRNGKTTIYNSDPFGYITSITDRNGHTTTYTYDQNGNNISETTAEGETTYYSYDSSNNIISMKDPSGNISTMVYDSNGNMLKLTGPDGEENVYTYDVKNQMQTASENSGVRKSYTYDQSGHVLTETTSGLGTIYYTYENGLQKTITDYRGNTTEMTYDNYGNIRQTKSEDESILTYTYDSLGRVLNIKDAEDGITTYAYDCNGNITSITDENGGKVQFEYDDNNNLVKEIDKLGNETVHIYDAEGRNIKTVYPDNSFITTQYDAEGCALKTVMYDTAGQPMKDNAGQAAGYVYTYDKANRLLTETDPNGNVTKHEYYQSDKEKKTTYPDQSYVTYEYDKSWRLTKAIDNNGNTYKYEYDRSGNLTKVTDPLDNFVTYEYNGFGQMISSKDANGNKTTYEYDKNGNCIKKSTPDGLVMQMTYDSQNRMLTASAVVDENTRYTVSYKYDALGRVTEYTDEENNVFTTEYDSMGNVTAISDANGQSFTRTEYDLAGNVTKTTDALNSVTEYTYDSLNRLKKTVSDKGKDTQATTSYAYDAFGRIIQAVDAENGKTKATYDNVGNILSITDPNGGTSTYKYDSMNRMTESVNAINSKNTYTYNAQGLLEESKNARNQSTTYTYDALGRITSATDALGTISYTYDANGNILTVTDEDDNIATREYDCMNRVTKYTDFRGNVVKYGYDTLGNLVTLEYAGGRIVRYSYYPTGRLKSVVDWNNRTTNYEYDGNGRLIKLSRPDGSVETYQYDAIGQLIEQTDLNGTRVINSFTYTYDTAGHIIKTESTNVAEETVSVSSATMEYDKANRLIKYNNETVQYDADGNMTYGPLNGVMTHFTYDCRNRLISAGNTTYEYDAENNRIAVTVNNVRTEYVVENNASQYSQILSATTSGETTFYIYGDGLLSQVDEDGNYLYYHFNNIGSTTVVTGDDGKIVHAFTYGTYGELLSGDTHGILFLYNGRYGVATDSNGLYYMRARYYNPDIKRFINQDVVEGNITNSPSLNRYAYCQGNPVSLLDPFGLSPQLSWSDIGHGVLDVLGMVPGVGFVADLANGFWYLSEGDYFSAAASFVSAVPGIGDVAGGIAKAVTGCTKISKAIKFATRFASKIGNFALGAYSTATQIYGLWDKYVIKGQPFGQESLGEFFGAAFTGVSTVLSGKGVVDDIANYSNVKHDILTSQCFVEGTLIVTNEGDKPIEEIQAGDLVYSTDPETGESEYKEVLRTFRKESDVLVHIFVNGEEIETTPVHPFWVEDQWVSAKDLETGDILTLADGTTAPVTYTYGEQLDEPVIVYNFEVAEFHTYYVTDTGVLVHNLTNLPDGCRIMTKNESLELPEYDAEQGITSGIMELDDGTNIFITSGNKDSRYVNYANDGHVEQKAALIMRENNISNATVRHNNPNGTCGWCNTMTTTFLPEGATLTVIPPSKSIANNSRAVTVKKTYYGSKKIPKLSKIYLRQMKEN